MEAQQSSKHEDDLNGVSLPEDLIFDVLSRLPAKALCRFRCVSKAWRALISDPAFVATQRSHFGRLFVGMFGSWPHYEVRVLDMHGSVLRVLEAIDSACLAPTRLDLICVGMTRHCAMIVDPAAEPADVVTVGIHAHDEMIRCVDFSFGRAAPSGAYKVLRLYKTHTTFCDVATITNGGTAETTWRQTPPPDLDPNSFSERKATINGVLYFMPRMIHECPARWNSVAAFDLESEVWMETITGPPLGLVVEPGKWCTALTVLKETLCMVHNIHSADSFGGHSLHANVWRLIDCNKSVWVKAYTIRMPAESLHIKVLDVLDDGRLLLLMSKTNITCCRYFLQFFNPSTEDFTDIMEMAEGFLGKMTFYTGSLLSP